MPTSEIAAIVITCVLAAMDYLTGLAKAVKNRDVSSEKMRQGLWHKSAYLLVIMLAEILEHGQQLIDMGFGVPIIIPACVYIIITEVASIIENLGELNPELRSSPILQLFRSTKTTTKGDQ